MITDTAKSVRVEDEVARRGGLDLKRVGDELIGPCPVCGGRDRFAISIRKQCFLCRGCGKSGDVISLVRHLDGVSFGDAVKTLVGEERKPVVTAPVVKPKSEKKLAHGEQNAARALKIWNDAEPIQNTLAEKYLKLRGLEQLPGDDVLRFHSRCPFADGHQACLIALYTDIGTNVPKAVSRTAIATDGTKIDRLSLGPMMGGAIKIDADENVEYGLTVGEGLETCLAARQLGFRPVWALGSAGGIKNFPVLAGIETLTILVDNDLPKNGRRAGQEAAAECAKRWRALGCEMNLVLPKAPGTDVADYFVGGGHG